MISGFNCVLLDIDGVLLSSIDHYTKLYRERSELLGAAKTVPDEFYRKNIGVRVDEWLRPIIPKENHIRIPELFFTKDKDLSEKDPFTLVDGAKNVLEQLRQNNQKISLISTMTRRSMTAFICDYEMEKYLDFSVSGDEVSRFKPDPEGIFKSLDFFKAAPEEAVFIGDSPHDLGAARNANVRFIGVLTGICTHEDWESEKAEYIHSIKDLYPT